MKHWQRSFLIILGFISELASLGLVVFGLRYFCPLTAWQAQANVLPDQALVVQFNQPIIGIDLKEHFSIEPAISGRIVTDDFRRQLVFKPDNYLLANHVYKIRVNGLWSFSFSRQKQADFTFYTEDVGGQLTNLKPVILPQVYAAVVAGGCDPLGAPTLIGKVIDVELASKKVWLYDDGECVAQYEVHRYGGPGTPTPKGQFRVKTKEPNHFSSSALVWMPWSMNFNGDVFLHGIPYFPNGAILRGAYSHGCIQMPTDQAEKTYNFANIGTPVYVR